MEPIKDFITVLDLLKRGEIVCISNPQMTYFGMSDHKIQAKNDQIRYTLSIKEFETMFIQESFYISQRKQVETIDESKDDEYYSWKNK